MFEVMRARGIFDVHGFGVKMACASFLGIRTETTEWCY